MEGRSPKGKGGEASEGLLHSHQVLPAPRFTSWRSLTLCCWSGEDGRLAQKLLKLSLDLASSPILVECAHPLRDRISGTAAMSMLGLWQSPGRQEENWGVLFLLRQLSGPAHQGRSWPAANGVNATSQNITPALWECLLPAVGWPGWQEPTTFMET